MVSVPCPACGFGFGAAGFGVAGFAAAFGVRAGAGRRVARFAGVAGTAAFGVVSARAALVSRAAAAGM